MNKIDKGFYKALKFLSRRNSFEVIDDLLDKDRKRKFRKFVSKEMSKTLQLFGYISFQTPAHYLVTEEGLKFLRELEDINRKDLTLIASVIAVVLSLVSLGISFFILAMNNRWFGLK